MTGPLDKLSKMHARIAKGYIEGALEWSKHQPELRQRLREAEDRLDEMGRGAIASKDWDDALDDLQMVLVDIVQGYRNARKG